MNRVFVRIIELDEDNEVALLGIQAEQLLVKADACLEAKDRAGAKAIWQQLLEIDTDNPWARKRLRHQRYDGQWFESYVALSKYKREEAKRKEEQGLKKWKGLWVPKEDVTYLNLGWEEDADGKWFNPVEAAHAKQIVEWKKAGYEYRADDDSWIAKDDRDKWAEGLFKCGEK